MIGHTLEASMYCMYSQLGVGPLLYLFCSSPVPLLDIFCPPIVPLICSCFAKFTFFDFRKQIHA